MKIKEGTDLWVQSRRIDLEANVVEAALRSKKELRYFVDRHFELFGGSNPYHTHPFMDLLDRLVELTDFEAKHGTSK